MRIVSVFFTSRVPQGVLSACSVLAQLYPRLAGPQGVRHGAPARHPMVASSHVASRIVHRTICSSQPSEFRSHDVSPRMEPADGPANRGRRPRGAESTPGLHLLGGQMHVIADPPARGFRQQDSESRHEHCFLGTLWAGMLGLWGSLNPPQLTRDRACLSALGQAGA